MRHKPLPGQLTLFEDMPVPCARCTRVVRDPRSIARKHGRTCWSKLSTEAKQAWLRSLAPPN